MERRTLGKTGLEVSRLGAGLAEIGNRLTFEQIDQAAGVLNTALDNGINFLDTAACYGISEELIGQTIANRRDEYVLATKCGHVAGGYEGEPWTAKTVTDSIDRSLQRMKTDRLDLVQLHSCGVDILEKGEVIEALLKARDAGKTRFVGYSGDNEAAAWAVNSGHFDTLQTSFNLVDQRARTRLLAQAKAKNMGIIIKRPIANAVWGADSAPSGYAAPYFERAQEMKALGSLPDAPNDPVKLALGFVWAHDEVDTTIVGTSNPKHMQGNIDLVASGVEIPAATVQALANRFDQFEQSWEQRG
jgi:aryl-alcohol dehydrogenase-like predicted oxidoreductase